MRTNQVSSVDWIAYSNYLGYDIYEVSFRSGGVRYTGPKGKDYILSNMEE